MAPWVDSYFEVQLRDVVAEMVMYILLEIDVLLTAIDIDLQQAEELVWSIKV